MPPPAVEQPLFWGMIHHTHIHGRRVEVWSDGPIAVAADRFGFQLVPRAGHITRFPRTLEILHVRPLNPIVSMAEAFQGGFTWREAWPYIAGQVSGGILGTFCANVMFALTKHSTSSAVW